MSDWLKNRGLGPWPFIPQPAKWGYPNNPRWTLNQEPPVAPGTDPQIWTPEDRRAIAPGTVHNPCGHWHKTLGPPPPPPPVIVEDIYVGGVIPMFSEFGTPDQFCVESRNLATGDKIWQHKEEVGQDIILNPGNTFMGADALGVVCNFGAGADAGQWLFRKLAREDGHILWTSQYKHFGINPSNPVFHNNYCIIGNFVGIGFGSDIYVIDNTTGATLNTIHSTVGNISQMVVDEVNGFLYVGGILDQNASPYFIFEKRKLSDFGLVWSINGNPLPSGWLSSNIFNTVIDVSGLYTLLQYNTTSSSAFDFIRFQKRSEIDGSVEWEVELSLHIYTTGWWFTFPFGGSLDETNLYWVNDVVDKTSHVETTWTIPEAAGKAFVACQASSDDAIFLAGNPLNANTDQRNFMKVKKSDKTEDWFVACGLPLASDEFGNTWFEIFRISYFKG